MTDEINLSNATPLEKANVVLDKVIAYSTNSPTFLDAVGIFRQSGDGNIVDGMYRKVDADLSRLRLENENDYTRVEHNVTGLLKRYILSDQMQWSSEAAAILANELHQKLDDRTFDFDFKPVIEKLIAENHLEEAKMLHNTLHMGYLVAAKSEKNKMTPANMFQTFAPWLAGMSKDESLYMMMTLAAKPVSDQNKDALGLYKNGAPVYGQTFDQTFPDAALKIKEQHANIPNRASTTVGTSNLTSARVVVPAMLTKARDWLTKIAIPAVKDFFTKKIPSLFRRLTGAKEKEPVVLSSPENPKEASSQWKEARPSQQWKSAKPTALKDNPPSEAVRHDVVMGGEMARNFPKEPPPPPPVESEQVNDAFNAGKIEEKVVRPPSITPSRITVEEQSAMQNAKGKALAFFKDLENKVEKKVSDLKTPKK